MWMLLLATAWAGYGDAVDGVPSPAERALHVWTDVARVELSSFQEDLRCSDAIPGAQWAPHAPLAWSDGLGAAARYHALDLKQHPSNFSHSSYDGTGFAERLDRYYTGNAIGENIAKGMGTPRGAVVAWLCSEGHRKNLLDDTFLELGTGNAGTYWVQDFGAAGRPQPVLRMGAHEGSGAVRTLYADVGAAQPPQRVDAVVDGARVPMDLMAGNEARGVWTVDVDTDGDCHPYWFEAVLDSGAVARFPEEGAYGWGACDWDDVGAQWLAAERIADLVASVPPAGEGCGCATGGGVGLGWAAVGLIAVARRRRGAPCPTT